MQTLPSCKARSISTLWFLGQSVMLFFFSTPREMSSAGIPEPNASKDIRRGRLSVAICKHLVALHNGSISVRTFCSLIWRCQKMDGYELLEKIRGLEQEVGWLPSIAFTASVRSEDRVRSRRARSKVRISNQLRARQRVSSS